ncbi:metallophosphoesterase family protein [Burkholderia gladioli]|uniref:metallophosphoesterase family protein n=1 Tax=Burkholderia gladioli TaxID=28095 RepID=UPI00163EF13B|nr:metallophosphoesterase [Burkholderia gladioli]MBU9319054.1 metallophosphoesterase [Burkholderia gladioli]MCA8171135.1 metallophosphoesterase [Burkholderia gladioli]
MSRLLQISDPHFGAERQEAVDALVRLVEQTRPELVVISGDLTQRARRHQFEAARAFVARLGAQPVLAIPGNHDLPLFDLVARWRQPYANYRRAFGEELEPVFDAPALLAIGVNTTRPSRHTAGEISAEQVARVARRLALASPAQLRVVVVHQPIVAIGPANRHDQLHGGEIALRSWAAAGADLVLGGHTHRAGAWRVTPRDDEAGRDGAVERPVFMVQGGTAVSRRLRAGTPNSVNLIDYAGDALGPRRAAVTRCDYDDESRCFIAQAEQHLDLAPATPFPLA